MRTAGRALASAVARATAVASWGSTRWASANSRANRERGIFFDGKAGG